MRSIFPSLPVTTTWPFSTVTRFTVLIDRLINVPSFVSITRRGPTSGSGSTGGCFGFGVSVAATVSRVRGVGAGAGLRPAGRRVRVFRTGAGLAGFSSAVFPSVFGVSTGFGSGVASGVGSGVGAAATSVTGGAGSSILAPDDDTRLPLPLLAGVPAGEVEGVLGSRE